MHRNIYFTDIDEESTYGIDGGDNKQGKSIACDVPAAASYWPVGL